MEILYEVHSGLYVNLTNKCSSNCVFCLRQTTDTVGNSKSLWLSSEPTSRDVINAFGTRDLMKYSEIVYCGFGEPTCALPVLLETASWLKAHGSPPIRVNTNGQGSLIAGRDISGELAACVDVVSVSLNHPDPVEYQRLVRSRFGESAYFGMLEFAENCVKHGLRVIMTTVSTTITHEDEDRCRMICERIGARYRIRPFE